MSDRFFRAACATLIISFFLGVAALVLMLVYLHERGDDQTPSPPLSFEPPSQQLIQAALLKPVDAPASPQAVVPIHDSVYTITGNVGRGQVITYTVQEGDTAYGIAERFHLTYCTLMWSNPAELLAPLAPGTPLTILPTDGTLYRVDTRTAIADIAAAYNVDSAQIIYSAYNPYLLTSFPDTVLESGAQVIIPNGNGGNCTPWNRPPWLVNNPNGADKLVGCDYPNPYEDYPTNAPMPDSNYRISRGFTPGVHDGIDMAAPVGTPVYAAGNGMVRFSGWGPDGYGNLIVIDHGGSFSFYGHLQTIDVTCGQPIAAKQLIGAVGSTGNSSNYHLHFEVRDGGFQPVTPRPTLDKGL